MSVKQLLMKPTQLSLQRRPSTTTEEFQLLPCNRSSQQEGFQWHWSYKTLPFLHRGETGHMNWHCLSYPAGKNSLQGIMTLGFTDVRSERHLHSHVYIVRCVVTPSGMGELAQGGEPAIQEEKPATKLGANLGLPCS